MSNKIDFDVAQELVSSVTKNADILSDKKNEIVSSFRNLGSTFKDDGYAVYEEQVNAVDKSIDVIVQDLKDIAKKIEQYTDAVKDNI